MKQNMQNLSTKVCFDPLSQLAKSLLLGVDKWYNLVNQVSVKIISDKHGSISKIIKAVLTHLFIWSLYLWTNCPNQTVPITC